MDLSDKNFHRRDAEALRKAYIVVCAYGAQQKTLRLRVSAVKK